MKTLKGSNPNSNVVNNTVRPLWGSHQSRIDKNIFKYIIPSGLRHKREAYGMTQRDISL